MEAATLVRRLQNLMKKNGFYDGEVDGIWGNRSEAGFLAMANAGLCGVDEGEPDTTPQKSPATVGKRWAWSNRSKSRLLQVHPDLVKVVNRALEISPNDLTIIEGMRTVERQKHYVKTGKSQTMNSRHLPQKDGYSHAVDVGVIVDGKLTWEEKHYLPLGRIMKQAAADVGVRIEWGGDWRSFKDYVHFQLPWS